MENEYVKPDYLSQREFECLELYLKSGNVKQSGIEAGYSEKTAGAQASRLINSWKGRQYINERMNKANKQKIADSDEVLQYLTSVMRGDIKDINFKTGEKQECGLAERTRCAIELHRRFNSDPLSGASITIINDIPKSDGGQGK